MVENSRVEGVSRIRWNDILNSLYSLDLLDSFILPPKIDMCLILKLKSLLESLIRNQQVVGSNPIPGFFFINDLPVNITLYYLPYYAVNMQFVFLSL